MQELQVDFEDLHELYKCYMPYLKNGGLFIRTSMRFDMGDSLALRVTLPDALEDDVVTGKVTWITCQGSQNTNPAGVGVSFIDDKGHVKDKIEKMIVDMLHSSNRTYTM